MKVTRRGFIGAAGLAAFARISGVRAASTPRVNGERLRRRFSHSPRELTAWDDCTRGADVLLAAILRADQMRMPT